MAPFAAIPYDASTAVASMLLEICAPLTCVVAAEAHLVQDPGSLQLFVGHEAGTGLKHYHRQEPAQGHFKKSPQADGEASRAKNLVENLVPQKEKPANDECKPYLANG